jgi:hypothetical protein
LAHRPFSPKTPRLKVRCGVPNPLGEC